METINADGVTTVGYDAAGDPISLTDPDGNTTTMAYDALGRMTGQTDPLNHTATYAYDAAGLMTSTTDPLGRVRNLSYDALNRETGETWVVSSVTTNVQTFTYDAAGDQLTAADYSGTYTNAYDALGRLTSQTDPLGLSLTYAYDAASDVTQRADSLGGVLTYVYDGAGRLTSEQLGGTGVTQARVDLAYDANDQVTTLTRYTDTAGTTLAGTTTYTYNAFEQLTGIFNATATGATLSYYNYTLNAAGLVTQENWQSQNPGGMIGGANTYTYDATDQVTDADGTAYSYDAAGNPDGAGDVVNAGNELTNDGTWTYTYDAAGDMIEQSKGPGLETWYYTYDALNHLLSVEQTSNGTSLTYAVTYSYDVYGNRYEEQEWATGGATTVTYTAYDQGVAWADLTSSLTVQTRCLAGPGVNQWFAQITSGGVEWLMTDRLGSVRDVVNSAGTLVLDHAEYQAFGGVASDTSAAAASVYEFDGERYNRTTGMLQSDGIRDVNTQTDQWDGPDPSGFGGGDPNLRRVEGNDPANDTDPSGLAAFGPRLPPKYPPHPYDPVQHARFVLWNTVHEWQAKGWKLAPNLLIHFLDNTGEDYVLSNDEISEIEPAVDDMARRVLALYADDMANGGTIDITHSVRWVNTDWLEGPIQTLVCGPFGNDDSIVGNEMMFYAYGGAVLKIHGTAHNVAKMPNGHNKFDADVTITIEDFYTFAPTDGGLRLVFESYAAAHYLETDQKPGYKPFHDKGSYSVGLPGIEYTGSPKTPSTSDGPPFIVAP